MRIPAFDLTEACAKALASAGLSAAFGHEVAEVLVEGDLLGHSTHGVALLPKYLAEAEAGNMKPAGSPIVLSDSGNSAAWDAQYLPGAVVTRRALDQCMARASRWGVSTVAITKSHHIGCLAAYLAPVAERGFAAIVATSSPATRSVAPFGSVEGAYSPNPIAAGWPTPGEPVILDISSSITTNNFVETAARDGRRLPGRWLVDRDGNPSDDPVLAASETPVPLLPVGGVEYGQKGFALGLLVEMLTSGLAGAGRVQKPDRWGGSVFVMVLDPALHGGAEGFLQETGFIAEACRTAAVPAGAAPVRLPGQRALERRREQLANGVELDDAAYDRLVSCLPAGSLEQLH